MEAKDLIAFEEDIKEEFLAGHIRAPIHLSVGSEEPLIEIFKEIRQQDWVFSTHRSHYHALLKGIPPAQVKEAIMSGHSMHINSKEHKFVTSSIVGGCLSIAVGVAMAIKRRRLDENVWVFVGDMAATTGIYEECTWYARGQTLPITFVIEDNKYSVDTPTEETWGKGRLGDCRLYLYDRKYPQAGVGKRVTF